MCDRKASFFALITSVCFLGLTGQQTARASDVIPTEFGKTKEGLDVKLWTLTNTKGVIVKLIDRGATITELHVPDRSGQFADVVLGFDDVAGYESDGNQYFGTIVGRVANRIALGAFELGGKSYTLAKNNGPNHLHGGLDRALDKVLWTGMSNSSRLGQGVKFSYESPDGEEGYPGNVKFTVMYTLTEDNQLLIDFEATSDQATPINMANHSYFNLKGAGAETVLDHELMVNADRYTPVDDTLIPTGELSAVEGTSLDFRKSKPLRPSVETLAPTPALGIDHNFALNGTPGTLRLAARVREPETGRVLTVHTTQPGLQVYSGNFLKGQTGKGGKTYAHRSAMCLETQHYPDSVHHANFPSVILEPGQTYRHACIYTFTTD